MAREKVYEFYEDAGHGWLKVNRKELEELGIADKITGWSYQYGLETVYLEEDGDLGTFAKAKFGGQIPKDRYKEKYSERSAIRNYAGYEYYTPADKEKYKKFSEYLIKKFPYNKKKILSFGLKGMESNYYRNGGQ